VSDYVLTTVYIKPDQGGRPVVHSYGPYTLNKAQSERKKLLQRDAQQIREERARGCFFHVSVNKILDAEIA
jgi:hypothetical protein